MINAYTRKPSALSIAEAVYESRPPLRRTTAPRSSFVVRLSSDPARIWTPDVLVHLELHPDRNAVGQDPPAERLRIEHAVDRREMNRGDLVVQVVTRHHVFRVVVVRAILDDELPLVRARQPIDVAPVHAGGFPAAGTLHVHDLDDAGWHIGDRAMSAGLDQHGLAAVEQRLHQRIDLLLQERLPAGD